MSDKTAHVQDDLNPHFSACSKVRFRLMSPFQKLYCINYLDHTVSG